jgi:hypothetical protein
VKGQRPPGIADKRFASAYTNEREAGLVGVAGLAKV